MYAYVYYISSLLSGIWWEISEVKLVNKFPDKNQVVAGFPGKLCSAALLSLIGLKGAAVESLNGAIDTEAAFILHLENCTAVQLLSFELPKVVLSSYHS